MLQTRVPRLASSSTTCVVPLSEGSPSSRRSRTPAFHSNIVRVSQPEGAARGESQGQGRPAAAAAGHLGQARRGQGSGHSARQSNARGGQTCCAVGAGMPTSCHTLVVTAPVAHNSRRVRAQAPAAEHLRHRWPTVSAPCWAQHTDLWCRTAGGCGQTAWSRGELSSPRCRPPAETITANTNWRAAWHCVAQADRDRADAAAHGAAPCRKDT